MKTRKIALLLALCLLFGCLAGCGSTEIRSYTEDNADASTNKFAAAVDAYKPNKQVMTVDGTPVYWNEYAYWLCTAETSYENYFGEITDWSATYDEQTGQTVSDAVTDAVLSSIKQYHVIEAKAAENGVTLGEEGEAYLEEVKTQAIQQAIGEDGTEKDLEDYLAGYYVDMDLFDYQNKIQYLYTALMDHIYGEDGSSLSEDDLNAFLAENEYVTVKHILFKTTDDSGAALSDEDKAAKKQQAETAAAQLKAETDQTKRVELFDTLMNENSEDPGLASYPNGYCFTSGQMLEAFETASKALEEYGVSDVVETTAGYHVILRLPTTPDDVVSVGSDGTVQTLRYIAAATNYDSLLNGWMDEAEIVWEPAFEPLDYAAIFTPKESFWKKLDVFGWFD